MIREDNKPQTLVMREAGKGKIIGFLITRFEDGTCFLQHFWIEKEFRNVHRAWALLKEFKKISGTFFCFNIAKDDTYLRKLLTKIFNIEECYYSNETQDFYLASFRKPGSGKEKIKFNKLDNQL